MKAIYAILFLFLLIFYSCNKDSGPTSVEGRVVEMGSNKTVPFAQVELMREKAELFSSALSVETVQTLKADGEGKFSLHFDAYEDYIYSVRAIATGYDQRLEATPIEKGSKNKIDVILYPFGYLKYHIKNVTHKYSIGFSYSCFSTGSFGENLDTMIVCQDHGNVTREVIYRLTSISDTITKRQDIFIPSHDTASITIEY